MSSIILFLTGNGHKVEDLGDVGIFEAQSAVEGYRKQGWKKVLHEYDPDTRTSVTILSKGASE